MNRLVPLVTVLAFGALAAPPLVFARQVPAVMAEPTTDADSDGVPDDRDPCLATPIGARQLTPGCSVLDLVEFPQALTDPVRVTLADLPELAEIPGIADKPATRAALDATEKVMLALRETEKAVRAVSLCDASALLEQADADLGSAGAQLDSLEREARTALPAAENWQEDFPDVDNDLAEIVLRAQHVAKARTALSAGRQVLTSLCTSATPIVTRGVVAHTLDALHRVVLTDGRIFGLAAAKQFDSQLWEGEMINVEGIDIGEDRAILTDFTADTGIQAGVTTKISRHCLRLRFAPVQAFPPHNTSPLVLDTPKGYDRSGIYAIERGMGFAVTSACKPKPNKINTRRYTMALDLTYETLQGDHITVTLAGDLMAGDDPVMLPDDIKGGAPATLIASYRVQDCVPALPGFGCSIPNEVLTESYPLDVATRGAHCTVQYDATEFDVNDQIPGDFRAAHVATFSVVPSAAGPAPNFKAEGYAVSGNSSSYPQVVSITNFKPFALHNVDFANINPGFDLSTYYGTILSLAKDGISHAAGLRWPHLRGKYKGANFRYACELPMVVRDVVNFCPGGAPNAYYRLPFAAGSTAWTQGQGNNAEPTHKGSKGFAYDMVTGCDEEMTAARGGVAYDLITVNKFQHQPNCLNFNDPAFNLSKCCPTVPVSCNAECCTENWCNSNSLKILHQDGTKAIYVHVPGDSVKPKEDDYVPRGAAVARTGVVGNSSGPHLHWEVNTSAPGRQTTLALFEAVDPDDASKILTCYEPKNGDPLRSNNVPQP